MAKTNVNLEALFMEQYEELSDEELMSISGGCSIWGASFQAYIVGEDISNYIGISYHQK